MWWRVYVVKSSNNENVRTEDFEADDRAAADAAADKLLKRGERVDQVVGIQP
jgi:hypothetical protein